MKILFLSGHYPPNTKGGAEISTHLIARGLVERGHDLTVITEANPAYTYEVEAGETERYEGVKVVRLPLGLTAKPLLEKRHARNIARALTKLWELNFQSLDFDVVHAHDFRSALVLYEFMNEPHFAQGLRGARAVVTARDYAQISGDTNYVLSDGSIPDSPMSFAAAVKSNRVAEAAFPRNMFRLFQYVWNVKYRARAFASFSKQIFISDAQQKEIVKHQNFGDQKQTVIYNPVSSEYVDKAPVETVGNSVLYAGRVEMYKGVGLLLAAWKNLRSPSTLRIVGRGAQKEEYEALVRDWDLDAQVTFSEHIPYDRLKDEYDKAAIIVAPHVWLEPFGRTIVEGMARGKIVVATNAGGASELVDDGKTGFLFERESVEDLAKTLQRALALSKVGRAAMGSAAREWVQDNLSLERIAQQHEDFYKE